MSKNQYDDKKMSLKITNIVLDADAPSSECIFYF